MIPALISMALLGGLLGLILAVASKRFHVETDPRIDEVSEALPGVNCGACGYPGCAGYAEAIVVEGTEINLCAPGGKETVEAIASIMGMEAVATEARFATVACQAKGMQSRFRYEGVRDCKAANVMGLAGGFKTCTYGCLGLGNCAAACPFDAIVMGADDLPHVNEDLCTGCGQCVSACPRGLTRVDSEKRVIFVQCKNRDKGAVANKLCEHACIGCHKCVKECPFDAIHVENNLAVIDYEKCKLCGKCVGVCPKQVIVNLRQERRERAKARES